MKLRFRALVALAILILAVQGAFALSTSLNSTDITLVLRTDGKADIYYSLEWQASGGEMHGFYFQGEAFKPVWDNEGCYADLPNGKRIPLDIKNIGEGKYDIVLAGGLGFSGTAYYFLHYAGDFAAAGLVGTTTSADHGELLYFDWAPVEWDSPMNSRTVHIVLPVKVEGEKLTDTEREAVPMLTEKSVNDENKIDYYGSEGTDGYYLTIRFYQSEVQTGQTQRLQLYFPKDYVPISGALTQRAGAGPGGGESGNGAAAGYGGSSDSSGGYSGPSGLDYARRPLVAFIVFGVLIALALWLYVARLRRYNKRAAIIKGIAWAGDSWIPPKLYTGTYQVPGKVAENLHPAEVAVLLELPLVRIVAIMLEGLKAQGIIEVAQEEPLQIKILTREKAKDDYEEQFLACFDSEGHVLSGLLEDFFETMIRSLQEKIWDCDIEATKAYYRGKLAKAETMEAERQAMGDEDRMEFQRRNRYWNYWYGYWIISSYPARYEHMAMPKGFAATYADFMRSSSCFNGCFAPGGASGQGAGKAGAC
ncbi:MAG: DUF2207 domain-containing protein, partial [Spirochaetaceae bacterium]|nr:DUF2207 domain-containing protein [Spirochaetaceae bacterium]